MRLLGAVAGSRRRAESFFVAGGATSGTAVNLQSVINAETDETIFELGDGWFQGTNITRAGVTIVAQNSRLAQFSGNIDINADNVTVSGIKRNCAGTGTGIEIFNPGATVHDCHIHNFAKTAYANGIWAYDTALDVDNPILITRNLLEDWGDATLAQFAAGISVGVQADETPFTHFEPFVGGQRAVIITHNTITGGPTTGLAFSACIQVFHPAEIAYNRCADVHNATIQVKTSHSWIHHNWCSGSVNDGALYNRAWSDDNLWEYNLVTDCDMGIDHFQGDDCTYQHNVFANVDLWMRIKEDNDATGGNGTDNLQVLRNTIYNVIGWSAWIWDTSGPGVISGIVCSSNVFSELDGNLVDSSAAPYSVVSGAGNVFHNVNTVQQPPNGTVANPQLANPVGGDYEVTNPTYVGIAGAEWPFLVGPQ